jgi:outer membrane protein assembly factor BamA
MERLFTGCVGRAALFGAVLLFCLLPRAFAQEALQEVAGQREPPLIVERFVCRGNASTSCEFILGHVYLDVGDALDERELREANLRLSTVRNFESVSIYLEKGSQRGRVTVVVEVREADPLEYNAAFGLSSRFGNFGINAAGGVTHRNLFGKGKILNFNAGAYGNLNGDTAWGHAAGIHYIDPHLFDTKRFYLQASAGYQKQRSEIENGDRFEADVISAHLALGVRLWSFSYLSGGYQWRPKTDLFATRQQRDGTVEVYVPRNHGGPIARFGWNTEDNPVFPTRGSDLQFGYFRSFAGRDEYSFSYRKHWRMGGEGVWTFGLGEDAALSLSYSRMANLGRLFPDVRRARWEIGPLFRPYYNLPDGTTVWEAGVSASLRFETKKLGIVSFSLFGSGTLKDGGGG